MKLEPFSILAIISAIIYPFFIGGIIGKVVLIVTAIFMSLSYRKLKKDSSYTTKWLVYVPLVIVIVSVIIAVLRISSL